MTLQGSESVVRAAPAGPRKSEVRRRWRRANAIGFVIGWFLYSIVGHGFTGGHGEELTWLQYFSHSLGLLAVAGVVFGLQRRAILEHVDVSNRRMVIGAAAVLASFWLGAETVGPPADWILAFTVLAAATWIGKSKSVTWSALTILCFWAGIAAAAGTIFLLVRTGLFYPDSVTIVNHTLFWVILGGVTGVAGGFFSSWPLSRVLAVRAEVK